MANYTLSLDLQGGDKAASTLDSLVSKVGALGGSSGASKISAFKVGVSDIAKAFSQASKESAQFEKNLSKVLGFSNKIFPQAFGDFASGKSPVISISGSGGTGGNSQAEMQKAADEFGKSMFASSAVRDNFKSITKTFSDLAVPESPDFLHNRSFYNKHIQGLGMPNYAQALSGIHGMGDITDVDKGSQLGLKGTIARLAPLLGEFAVVLPIVVAGLGALALAANEIRNAIGFGAKLYSSALTNGLSTKLQAQRQITGDVLGVDPAQVNRFSQSAYVMKQLSRAIDEISKDAPTLALIGVQFKILGYDLLALASNIATKLSPAILGLINIFDTLTKWITANILGFVEYIKTILRQNPFGELILAIVSKLSKIGSEIQKQAGFNSPLAMMKQLPASAWEHMGLVFGSGSQNYAKDTAKNTHDTAKAVNRMAKYFSRNASGKPTWGMVSTTAQP